MNLKELSHIGLTQGQIKVYSAILNIGTASVNQIHEKTGLERRAIYDIINKLIEKGLITYTTEKKKRTYKCAPPNKLQEKINEKKQELENFEKIIPEINKLYNSKKEEISLEVYRGEEGIKTLFEDMLNYKENRFLGRRWYVLEQMPLFWIHYNRRRIKDKVTWYNLSLHDAPKFPKEEFMKVKVLPEEFSGSPSIIWIFGNKVAHVNWGENLFAFVMESKEIADNYKKYHKYLWDKVAK